MPIFLISEKQGELEALSRLYQLANRNDTLNRIPELRSTPGCEERFPGSWKTVAMGKVK